MSTNCAMAMSSCWGATSTPSRALHAVLLGPHCRFSSLHTRPPMVRCSLQCSPALATVALLLRSPHWARRYDMIQQSPYVSREQCVVRVAPDGTASILSIGKPPTVVCSPDGECYGLQRGRTHVLTDGERIALKSTFLGYEASFDAMLGRGAGAPPQGIFTVYALPDNGYAADALQGLQGGYFAG